MRSVHAWFALSRPAARRLLGLAAIGFGLFGLAPSSRAQLYSQNFSGGSAPGWDMAAGTWSVTGGTGGYYTDTANTAGPNVSYYGGATFDTGFAYTASVRLYGSGTANQTGVVYYYQNSTNYYEVELNPITPTGTVQLIEHIASAPGTVAATGTFASTGGGNYQTVAIVRSGTTTTIKINGTTVITRTEAGLTGGGFIGAADRWAEPRITGITVADTATPTVSVTAPTNGASVSGTINVTASASDPYGIASVQFKLDGANLGSAVTTAPYTVSWNTSTATLGSHTLTATATNVGGIGATSSGVSVTVGTSGSSYSQDFSSGTAPGWDVLAGTWAAVGGTGSYYGDLADTAGPNVSYYTGATYDTNYTYTASVRLYGSGTANQTGVVYYYQNSLNYYEVELNPITPTGTVQLIEHINSAAGTVAATGTFASNGGGNYQTVAVVRSGTTTTIQINGTTVITRTETGLTGGGFIGAADRWADPRITGITVTGSGGSPYKSVFPKLGGILYYQHYENTTFQAQVAKFDLAILSFYKAWNVGGLTIQQAVEQIKARNPSILLGNYTDVEAGNMTNGEPDVIAALNGGVGPTGGATWTPNNWWAHSNTGAYLADYGTDDATNITSFVTPNSNGDHFTQWYAKWAYAAFFSPVPQFDFMFSDVGNYIPLISADWQRNGTNESPSNPTVGSYYRAGMASYWAEMNVLDPSLLVMDNSGGMAIDNVGYLSEPEYLHKVGAALKEGAFGLTSSEETWSGYYNNMAGYRSLLANTTSPNIVMVAAAATSNGLAFEPTIQANYGGGAPYAFLRYSLASVLMDNGYFEVDDTNYEITTPLWFDEFDKAGTATTSWLGAAVDPPQTTPYQNGVFVRRFQNGMAIVNPRTEAALDGNGNLVLRTAETITPPSGYKRFVGTQDPVTNNGAAVTTITIQPGDGIILTK